MSIIPLQTKIDFIENVVILSFGDPAPFAFTSNDDDYKSSRIAWIRTQIGSVFPNLSDAEKTALMWLSNTIPRNLKEAKAELAAERQFLLQQAQMQEAGPIMTTLKRIETIITKARSEKSGSTLTNTHLRCFGTIVTPEISQLQLCPDPDPHFDEVKAEVRKLAQGLIDLYLLKNEEADEVNEIQPLTFDFFEKTCKLYFPDIWKSGQLSLVKKKDDDSDIFDVHYHVKLFDEYGNCHPVNGETDSTLFYRGVPVGVWEDKNFQFQLTECGVVAQAFAEVHYSAGEISNVSQQLGSCSGILTSGLNWTLIMKSRLKGNVIHERTNPISLIDTSQTPPVEMNVDDVTKLVLLHLQVIQSNIQLIDTSLSKLPFHARIEKDEDEHLEDNQDGTEPQKKKPKTGPHANQSRGGGRRGRRKGGSGKQGRRYANLQLQSSNSLLTLENVYKFNSSQPIFI